MTYSELLHAWSVIERIAQMRGITPAEVRADMKAALAHTWAEEEYGDDKTLHDSFPNGIPSVEAAITRIVKLTREAFGDYDAEA